MRKLISSGSKFEDIAGYSRAVVDDDYVHVSGTTGFDYGTMQIKDDLGEQTHQAMKNIDLVAKQNTVATRQATQAAENLNALGASLAKFIGK